ncbi:hypothetical protein KAR91_08030 [Candidatus Pacearchaeota archaeon]|nr:hypothetical protein [Candidatus Pacearchaeota archaeon]
MERFKVLIENAQWIPFLLSTGTPKLSTARIFESIIIAGMAGAMSVWATTLVIKTDITYIKQSQSEAKDWYRETKDEIKELTVKIYEHKHP